MKNIKKKVNIQIKETSGTIIWEQMKIHAEIDRFVHLAIQISCYLTFLFFSVFFPTGFWEENPNVNNTITKQNQFMTFLLINL